MTAVFALDTPLPEGRVLGARARLAALVSLYAMAAGAVWSPPLVLLGELVILGLLIAQVTRAPRVFLRSGLFWLTAFFVAYVVIRGAAAALERPDLAALHWEGVRRWVKAGPLPVLMIAVAFALAGRRQVHIRGVLLTALLVLTADLLLRLEPLRLLAAVTPDTAFENLDLHRFKNRYVFDRHFAFMSLLYSLALMGLVVLGTSTAWRRRDRPRQWVPIALGTPLLLIFYATALVAGGARTSWFATLAGLGVMVAAILFHGRGRVVTAVRTRPRSAVLLAVTLAAVLAVFGALLGDRIQGRLANFGDTPAMALEVVAGDRTLAEMPDGSVGDRLAYYVFGSQLISERPLIGYGPGRPRHLVFRKDAPHQIDDRQSHWHSQYLDQLLRFGLLGFVPVVALFALAVRGVLRGWREGHLGGEYVLFMLGAVTVYAVWSLADQRFTNYTMVAVVSLFLGAGCSFLLRPRDAEPDGSQRPPAEGGWQS